MTVQRHIRVFNMTTAFRRSQFLALPANDTQSCSRKLGLYRIHVDGIGECAVVHRDAGDGAPFLQRDLYEALHFSPPFDALPFIAEHEQLGPFVEHCGDDPMIG
jgi:hypothetical protein